MKDGLFTCNTNECAGQEGRHVRDRLNRTALPRAQAIDALDSAGIQAVPGVVQPEGAGDAVRVPTGEQRCGDADEVGEDGDTNGQHEGGAVGEDDEHRPRRPAQDRVVVQMARLAEQADEEQFRRRVRVQRPGDQEVRQRDPVCGFGPFRG